MTDDRNLSTEHQRKGDARRPSDTLDKDQVRSPDRPTDAGARAGFDPKTGEVRGAGVGAGGGSSGEDHDRDPQGGSGTLSESETSARERSGAADD